MECLIWQALSGFVAAGGGAKKIVPANSAALMMDLEKLFMSLFQ